MNRNKRKTDPVSVIFGLNWNFFFIRFVDTLVLRIGRFYNTNLGFGKGEH